MMRVIVTGASGRMGRMLVRAVAERDDAELVGATEKAGSVLVGTDAGKLAGAGSLGVPLVDDVAKLPQADVLIDFTTPEASLEHARFVAERGMRMVIGTTGFSDEERARLEGMLEGVGAVIAANFSVGVNLCLELVRRAASALDNDYDVEIVEMHHRRKVDAPSGTAFAFGEAAARGRNVDLRKCAVFAREGITGPRPDGAIGFAVVRGGGVVGEHRAMFLGEEEMVEIRHEARDRMVFARGALRAARWLVSRPPAIYEMRDVLGF